LGNGKAQIANGKADQPASAVAGGAAGGGRVRAVRAAGGRQGPVRDLCGKEAGCGSGAVEVRNLAARRAGAAPRADRKLERAETVRCLIIKPDWLEEILAGRKTTEFRSRATNIRGRIGLIASGRKGEVLGTVELWECMGSDGNYEWMLRQPTRCQPPVRFQQPRGCVIWVNGPEMG